MEHIFSRKEAAKYAGVCERTILRAINSKQLVAEKLGQGKTCPYFIEHEALESYKQQRRKNSRGINHE